MAWFRGLGCGALFWCGCSAAAPPQAGLVPAPSASFSGQAGRRPEARSEQPLPARPDPLLWATVARPIEGSVTLAEPGGSAPEPQAAALVRLLEEPLGMVRDKDDQVRLFLPDKKYWKRVRYRTFEHLVGFRYGGRHRATVVVLTLDTHAGRAPDSLACIRHAETLARPRIRALSVKLSAIEETSVVWEGQKVIVHAVDGTFPYAFQRIDFSAAWAAYPAYDQACLVVGVGFQHGDHPELARLARDRFILDALPRVEARTKTKAVRK